MLFFRSLRAGTGLLAFGAVLFLVALHTGGCADSTSPAAAPGGQAPSLPDPADLQFDFAFFDDGFGPAKSDDGRYDNFVNAALRAVVLQALAELTLAPPVAAFAVALQAVPVPQADGAWIWSYTWTGTRYPVDVALRGLPLGDIVRWELRVGPAGAVPAAVWFEGSTSGDGRTGSWLFHDLDDPAQPVCGEIAWGNDADGRFLEFTSREPAGDGAVLRFSDADPDFAITFVPRAGDQEWFIRWRADGSGSLRVHDYEGGTEACWDRWREDADCE